MRDVLHVITSTEVGGAENHLLALATGLQREGWRCEVAYLKGRGDLDREFAGHGIVVHPLQLRRWCDPAALKRLVRLIRGRRPDIVHAHLFPAEVYAAAAVLVSRSRAKLVCSKHNDEDFLRRPDFRFLHWLISLCAVRTIVISEHLRRFTLRTGAAGARRLVTIPYGHTGVAPTRTREDIRRELGVGSTTFVVGSVGRLVPQKGHRYLIDAMRAVVAEGPDSTLVIVGEGPLRESLKAHAEAAGLTRHVHFAGFRRDIPDLLSAFDVFALPSLWEGFGLVLLEAMAAARPIVASRVSAIPEVVEDGVTGLLVPPGDASTLAQALLGLRADPAKRDRLGAAGFQRLRAEFSEKRVVERTAEVYRAVLGEAGG